MQRSFHFSWILGILLAGLLAAPLLAAPLLAQSKPDEIRSPRALRAELRPAYVALLADEEYEALKADVEKDPHNAEKLDRYLRKLPASPLTLLQLDMEMRHYEYAIPRFIMDLHLRWIQLNEQKARRLYGDEHVDYLLSDVKTDTGETPVPQKTWTGTNRNVASTYPPTPDEYQGEIQLMVNPNNPKQIVAASNSWDDMNGTCGTGSGIQAVFYSSDGGVTWGYSCPPDESAYPNMSCNLTYVFGSDPALAWNDNNEVFLNYILLCSGMAFPKFALVVAKSTNGGANWTAQGVIKNSWSTSDYEDKNFYIIDNTPTSPYYGRHYACWDRSGDEKVAYSSDGGATWTEVDLPTTVGDPPQFIRFDLGCDLAVAADGTVHIVFDTLDCVWDFCVNEEMFYTRSTDGGATWSTPLELRDFGLVSFDYFTAYQEAQNNRGINPFGGIAIDNSGGPCNGTLYNFFSDINTNTNVDVYVSRSTDNGNTWDAPVKVNDDGLANATQFHPFAQVDQTNGSLVIGWHDTRNDPTSRAVDFFLTRSTDCGVSFEDNIQVSQPSSEFNNSTISTSNENTTDNPAGNPNQYGEYLGVDALNCKAYMAWTDTRHFFPGFSSNHQKENLGFAVVDFECHQPCGPGFCSGGAYCDSCQCYDPSSDISRAFCKCRLLKPTCGIGPCIGDYYCDGLNCLAGVCWGPKTPQSQVMCGGATLDKECQVIRNDCGPGYCTLEGGFCDGCACFPPGSNISRLFCQCNLLNPMCGLGECAGESYCAPPSCSTSTSLCYSPSSPISMGMCGGVDLDESCNPM